MFDHNETLEEAITRNVRDALLEDLGRGDWTANLIAPDRRVSARVLAREDAVLCGFAWFERCIGTLDPDARVRWKRPEGARIDANTMACEIEAGARALLSAERAALNFLQTLSSTATFTRRFVDAIEGVSPNPAGCAILDTRKTLPGLRQAQKYAVRIGGGANHRLALWDGILIKENHIAAAGGIAAACRAAQALHAGVTVQIEVENLAELREALEAGATNILLDNFTTDAMCEAYDFTAGRAVLEVSGGVDLDTVRTIASTGIDRISIGTLTKDVRAIDFSMRVVA